MWLKVSAVEWAIIAVGFMNVPKPHGFGPDHSHFLQAKQYTPCHGPSSPTMEGVNICKHSEWDNRVLIRRSFLFLVSWSVN